jgi:hypothetical protein
MCRDIKRLRHPDHPPTDQELHDAALQFIRKISGFRAPSRANQDAFDPGIQAPEVCRVAEDEARVAAERTGWRAATACPACRIPPKFAAKETNRV